MPSVLIAAGDGPRPPSGSARYVTLRQATQGRPGGWTLLRALPGLASDFLDDVDWVFFAPHGLAAPAAEIEQRLARHDPLKTPFVGQALCDARPTPLHHYRQDALPYPDPDCGFALSAAAVRLLSKRWQDRSRDPRFHIDPTYEFAAFAEDVGLFLTDDPSLPRPPGVSDPLVTPASPTDVVFAVKTHAVNHGTRIPVLRDTWGADATHLHFFSDIDDLSIPSLSLNIPNAPRGHGRKLHAILRHLSVVHDDKAWFVVVDDDTLLSVPRLMQTLGGFTDRMGEPIFVGERYGYGYDGEQGGYDFITLGGGMAVNRTGLSHLVAHDPHGPRPDSPDDMWVGQCLRNMDVAVVHHRGFHQQPPSAYHPSALARSRSVSFHRHGPDDPHRVYADYLRTDPLEAEEAKPGSRPLC